MEDKRALIVDDSKTACVVLSRVLKKYDIESDSCHNGLEALEYLKHSRPCVIFMDHNMPGMDGFEVVRRLKGSSHTATIPVMMYTGRSEEAFIDEARAAGVVNILSKQFKQQHVEDALRQLRLLPDQIANFINDPPGAGYAAAVVEKTGGETKIVEQEIVEQEFVETEAGEREPYEIVSDGLAADEMAPLEAQLDLSTIEALVDEKINEFYNATVKPHLAQSLFNGFAEQTEHRKTREKQLLEQLKESINTRHLESLKTMEKLQRQMEVSWQRESEPKFRRVNYIAAAVVFILLGFGASQWYLWGKLASTERALQQARGAAVSSTGISPERQQASSDSN